MDGTLFGCGSTVNGLTEQLAGQGQNGVEGRTAFESVALTSGRKPSSFNYQFQNAVNEITLRPVTRGCGFLRLLWPNDSVHPEG